MSLNAIVGNALSALQTNASALRVVSGNVANINTEGYARRVVNLQTNTVGGQLGGVDIASIQRVVDKFLQQETLSAGASSARFDTQNSIFTQLNGLLGKPGDGTALTSRLDNLFAALGDAALSPTSSVRQQGALSALQSLTSSISSLSGALGSLQQQVDQQVASTVSTANSLIKQIDGFNKQIQSTVASGDSDSGVYDQRDLALQKLAQLIDIRVAEQPNGQMVVTTADGLGLVGDSCGQLSYNASATNGVFGQIMLQDVNNQTGAAIGSAIPLDPHLTGGSLKGLVEMRDGTIGDLMQELGAFAQKTALALNAQHNANSAFPPPASLTGRNTGLLAADALNFTGKTTLAVASADGSLAKRIDINFTAGTLSVNGGAAVSIGTSVGSLTAALNTALGGNGSASFAGGKLSLSASGDAGIVVQDDATTPANRGGYGFSHFFGLNDLVQSGVPSILSTGFKASDASGLAAGGTMSFVLRGPNGEIARNAAVTVTAGMTMGQVVTAMNTAFGGSAAFALDSTGALTMTPSPANAGYKLSVTNDTTARGSTGMGFTTLFGLGTQRAGAQAQSFAVRDAVASAPDQLALGIASLSGAVVGDTIVSHGDGRGALALQDIATSRQTFGKVGALGAQVATLGDYAAGFYQDVATRTDAADSSHTAQADRLQEAQSRLASDSGVNLDEELSHMMIYQQAYAAGARILQTVQQMYDTLLQIR